MVLVKSRLELNMSVFGLYARISILKVIGILFLMGLTQILLFVRVCFLNDSVGTSFLTYLDAGKVSWICLIGFLFITMILCLSGTEYSSKTGYTLKRLSVNENMVFFHQTIYNIFVYVLFGAFQLVMIYLLGVFFQYYMVGNASSQFLFLSFYQSPFLHALFPMEEGLLWFRNLCWLIAFGIVTADFSYVQRRGSKVNPSLIVMVAMALVFGRAFIGSVGNCIFTSFVALSVVGCVLLCTVFGKEDFYES